MLDLLFGGRNLIFESPLSLEDATVRLQGEVTTPEWRLFENRRQLFMGTFAGGRFHIFRLASRRSSFKPTIDGTLTRTVNGCRVNARLKLAPGDLVAVSLLITIAVTMLLFGLQAVAAVLDPAVVVTDVTVVELLSLLIATLMLLGSVVSLIIDARRATRALATLFESQPPQFISRTVARQSQA